MNPILYLVLSVLCQTTIPPKFDTDTHAGYYVYYQTVDERMTYSEQVGKFYDLAAFVVNENPEVLTREGIWKKALDQLVHDRPDINYCED